MKYKAWYFVLLCFIFPVQSFCEESNSGAIEIFRNLKCLTCNGQSIEESNSDFSKNLKEKIEERIKQGYKKKEIYKEIEMAYGKDIFFTSPYDEGFLIKAIAFIFILCTGFFIYFKK